MREIWVDKTRCTQCQKCARECFLDIITAANGGFPQINDPGKCIGCGHCVAVCPSGAMMHSDFPYSELLKAQPDVVGADDAETMLLSRRSCRAYKPDLPARGDLERMLRVATMTPSAVNCEDRGFVVITDPGIKREIRRHGWDQAQFTDCSVLVLICGDRNAYRREPERYWANAPAGLREALVPMITRYYGEHETARRDENLRRGVL